MKHTQPIVDATHTDAPWHSLYGDLPRTVAPEHPTALAMCSTAFARAETEPVLWYFDRAVSGVELGRDSDALACALVLHRNFVYSSEVFKVWAGLGTGDLNLVLAPVFHITGLVAGLGASLAAGVPMLLSFRFDVEAVLEHCVRQRPTFTVAAITRTAR